MDRKQHLSDQIYFYELSLLPKMVFLSVVVKHQSEYSFRYKSYCFDVLYINLLSQIISLITTTVKIGYNSIVIYHTTSILFIQGRSFYIATCRPLRYQIAKIWIRDSANKRHKKLKCFQLPHYHEWYIGNKMVRKHCTRKATWFTKIIWPFFMKL